MKYLRTYEEHEPFNDELISMSKMVEDWWNTYEEFNNDDDEAIFMAFISDPEMIGSDIKYSVDTRGEEIPNAIDELNIELNKFGYSATHNLNDGELLITKNKY